MILRNEHDQHAIYMLPCTSATRNPKDGSEQLLAYEPMQCFSNFYTFFWNNLAEFDNSI